MSYASFAPMASAFAWIFDHADTPTRRRSFATIIGSHAALAATAIVATVFFGWSWALLVAAILSAAFIRLCQRVALIMDAHRSCLDMIAELTARGDSALAA